MPQPTDIAQLIDELTVLSEELAKLGQRQIVLLAGDLDWGWKIAQLASLGKQSSSITHEHPPTSVVITPKTSELNTLASEDNDFQVARPDKPTTLLGFESRHVVFDAHSGFYPDALCAIAGTIEPGGFLFVLCPDIIEWPNLEDGFAAKRTSFGYEGLASSPNTISRFIEQIKAHGGVITQHNSTSENGIVDSLAPDIREQGHALTSNRKPSHEWTKPSSLTTEQTSTLNAITSDLPSNLGFHILQADRGRGKSHLLGLIANTILNLNIDNGIKCILTGPNKASVKSVYRGFETAAQSKRFACEQAPTNSDIAHNTQSTRSTHGHATADSASQTLKFVAPEDVLDEIESNTILIVDEAASLPIPILKSWAQRFKKIIFATTTHGYEGTGKGFQIRFLNFLETLPANIHQYELTHPIRYCENDPVEQTLFKTFCLDCEPTGLTSNPALASSAKREILQSELADNTSLLEELFSLLVQAHYQTRPSDLRDILDAPGIRIFGCFNKSDLHNPTLLSACLLINEGSFKEDNYKLIEAIANGKRRPKGHLVPQVLTLHMGELDALKLKSARIVRIATLPNLQRNSIGSQLLHFISETLKNEDYDFISSSYADTEDVRSFWLKNKFNLIRLGNKFDQSSGTRSGLVINGLSNSGQALETSGKIFFDQQSEHYQSASDISLKDKDLIKRFINETGSYEAIKDILVRCEDWNEQFKLKQFPKKAGKDFRELVKDWFE